MLATSVVGTSRPGVRWRARTTSVSQHAHPWSSGRAAESKQLRKGGSIPPGCPVAPGLYNPAMNRTEFTKFLDDLHANLSPPFLPEGFVTLSHREDGTHVLSVGDRDVELGRTGEFLGSGTNVGPARAWEIRPR